MLSGVEGLAKEIEALRIAAQNEMLLNEESSPAAVLDELQQLRSQLAAHAQELARINQFQRLFKVSGSEALRISIILLFCLAE
jgi:hypothetical protein